MPDKIDVTRSFMPPFEEYAQTIRPLWDSRRLTNGGALHAAFADALREYLGVSHLSLCVNGHQALEGVLTALGLTGEVITTPFTFVSTTNAILRCGLTPVFCDVLASDGTMDPDALEPLITERTSAILPVHVYGNLCQTEAIERIAQKYHLKVVYDAAHAFGVTKNGVGAAAFGDAAMFSFHATKVFHSIEGGAAVFRTAEAAAAFDRWKNFGLDGETPDAVGPNAKMNEFAAAMGLCNLKYVASAIAARKAAAEAYREHLSGIPGVTLPAEQKGVQSNYAYYPVRFDPAAVPGGRDAVLEALAAENIMARRYFSPLTSVLPACGGSPAATPAAARWADTVLCLPMYAELTPQDVARVCGVIKTVTRP